MGDVVRVGELNLTDTIGKILVEYGDEASEAVKKSVLEVGKEAVKKLKATSPKLTGDYRKSWKGATYEGRFRTTIQLYSEDEYPLTHLLENGHAKRGGGRVAPIEHIRPVEQWANEEVVKRIKRELG